MSNDAFKGVVSWSLPNGSIAQNVVYATFIGGDALADVDLTNFLGTHWEAIFSLWLTSVNALTVLDQVAVYEFNPVTGVSQPKGTFISVEPGTATGTALPQGVSVKVNLFPPGRKRPGGMYLPAPTTSKVDSDGSIINAALLDAVAVGVGQTLVVDLQGGGLDYYPTMYSALDNAMIPLWFASVQLNDTFDYMRSRKDGVGI